MSEQFSIEVKDNTCMLLEKGEKGNRSKGMDKKENEEQSGVEGEDTVY